MTMTVIKRRGLLAGAAVLAAGGARAQGLLAHEVPLYEAAKRESEITWYTGQMQAEPSEAVGRAFTERYPGVKVNVVRSTSQVVFQRISQDARARVNQCDVLSTTDLAHFSALKGEGKLMDYRPVNAAGMVKPARDGSDPDGTYYVTYLGLYMISRRTDKVTEANAPKTWKDLLDPKWKNQLAVGHPGFSGAIGAWGVMMRKLYGEGYFKELERNKPQIGRSSADPVTTLNAGERTVGVAIPSATTLLTISRGNPQVLIYPSDGVLVVPAPSACMKAAPHPNAAKLFIEFMTSPGYSTVTRGFFDESLRPEVPPAPGGRTISELKTMTPTLAEYETGIPEIKELWRDIFGV
jgi:iron(III) transport system substrate-binding protein